MALEAVDLQTRNIPLALLGHDEEIEEHLSGVGPKAQLEPRYSILGKLLTGASASGRLEQVQKHHSH